MFLIDQVPWSRLSNKVAATDIFISMEYLDLIELLKVVDFFTRSNLKYKMFALNLSSR